MGVGLTLINFGMPLGAFLQGYSDRFGRSVFVLINGSITFLFGLLSVIAWNFPSFILLRFLYDIGIGMCLPLASVYVT